MQIAAWIFCSLSEGKVGPLSSVIRINRKYTVLVIYSGDFGPDELQECCQGAVRGDEHTGHLYRGGRQGFQKIVDSTTFPCVHLHFYKKKKT